MKKARTYTYAPRDNYTPPTADKWLELATACPARDPNPTEEAAAGFMPPVGDDRMTVGDDKVTILSLRISRRRVPSAVVREAVQKRVDVVESEEVRKVSRKERQQIQEAIYPELLSQAFITHSLATIVAFDDTILIDGSSEHAELFFAAARKSFGSLPAITADSSLKQPFSKTMLSWITKEIPAFLCMADDVVLVGEDDTKARYSNGIPDDIASVASEFGAQSVLSIRLHDEKRRFRFTVNEELNLTRIKFDDIENERAEAEAEDDVFQFRLSSLLISAHSVRATMQAIIAEANGIRA